MTRFITCTHFARARSTRHILYGTIEIDVDICPSHMKRKVLITRWMYLLIYRHIKEITEWREQIAIFSVSIGVAIQAIRHRIIHCTLIVRKSPVKRFDQFAWKVRTTSIHVSEIVFECDAFGLYPSTYPWHSSRRETQKNTSDEA